MAENNERCFEKANKLLNWHWYMNKGHFYWERNHSPTDRIIVWSFAYHIVPENFQNLCAGFQIYFVPSKYFSSFINSSIYLCPRKKLVSFILRLVLYVTVVLKLLTLSFCLGIFQSLNFMVLWNTREFSLKNWGWWEKSSLFLYNTT